MDSPLIRDCYCGKKQVPVNYIKLTLGFFKLCKDCEEAVNKAGLVVPSDIVRAQ